MDRRKFLQTTSVAAAGVAAGARSHGSTAESKRRVRVVQIGTEHAHAASKCKTLRSMPDRFELLGIYEPDTSRRDLAVADADFAGANWFDRPETIRDLGVDALLVETELPGLVEWSRFGLESGWHVHIDKPPGSNREGIAGLHRLAASRSLVLQMGYMYRYHPAFRFCLDAVANEWVGRPFAVHGEIGKVVSAEQRSRLAEVYDGSMMELGCHLLDMAVAVLGSPTRVNPFRRRTFPDQDAFFDHELVVLEYPDALATVRSMMSEVGGVDRRQFVVCGENGTIEIRPLEPARVRLSLTEPAGPFRSGEQTVDLQPVGGRYDAQLKDFHAMICGRPSSAPEFDAEHDRRLQDVLVRSAAESRVEEERP